MGRAARSERALHTGSPRSSTGGSPGRQTQQVHRAGCRRLAGRSAGRLRLRRRRRRRATGSPAAGQGLEGRASGRRGHAAAADLMAGKPGTGQAEAASQGACMCGLLQARRAVPRGARSAAAAGGSRWGPGRIRQRLSFQVHVVNLNTSSESVIIGPVHRHVTWAAASRTWINLPVEGLKHDFPRVVCGPDRWGGRRLGVAPIMFASFKWRLHA